MSSKKTKPSAQALLTRMEEIMERLGWSKRHWAIVAGLSEASHVSTLMRNLRKDSRGRRYGDLHTWALLVEAAGVSLDYLVFGRGDPHGLGFEIPSGDKYPSRAIVLGVAHALGFSEATISEVAALEGPAVDPGREYWLGELIQRERLRQKLPRPRRRRKSS